MNGKEIQDIVIIGAGNVGTHLALTLHKAGYSVRQVLGRNMASVTKLAKLVNAVPITDFGALEKGLDLYIIALPEKAMGEALPMLNLSDELLVHTSGSLPIDILFPFSENTGVFYPLQTFTHGRMLTFSVIPVLIEANSINNETVLLDLANNLSNHVQQAGFTQRKALHLAAVFACNFSNHMYEIARQMLDEQGLDFELLAPLIRETTDKALDIGPGKSQTGPALRGDSMIMDEHLKMLKDKPALKELYKRISGNIKDQQ